MDTLDLVKKVIFDAVFQKNKIKAFCWSYVFILIPSFAIIAVTELISRMLRPSDANIFSIKMSNIDLFGIIIFAPVIETLLLAASIWIVSKITSNSIKISFVCAILWAFIHGTRGFSKIGGIAWTFFGLSMIFIEWRKFNFKTAYFMTLAPHICLNLTSMIFVKVL